MPETFSKRRTQIDFSSFGDIKPRLKAGSLDQIPEEEIADARTVSNYKAVRERFGEGDRLTYPDAVDSTTGLKRLRLVEAIGLGVGPHEYIRTKHLSPWDTYEKLGELRLGVEDWVTVAQRSQPLANVSNSLSNLVVVRKYSGSDAHSRLQRLQQIRHTNIVSVREIFAFEGASHVIFEHMVICLSQVAGNLLLNEIRLAAILGQVNAQNNHREMRY